MTVYVLYAEYQSGEALAGVNGVYATLWQAEAARVAAIAQAHQDGWIVWGEERPEAEDEDQADWTVTYHIEEFEVQP